MEDKWNQFSENYIYPIIHDPQFNYFYLIGACLAVAIALAILIGLRRRSRAIRVFDNQAGHIHVSNRALADLVKSACEKVGSVHKPHVRFSVQRGKLHLSVKLKLEEGKRLAEVSAALQAQLTNTLQETLSIEKIGRIDIIVTGFIKAPQGKVQKLDSNESSLTPSTSQTTPIPVTLSEPEPKPEPEDKPDLSPWDHGAEYSNRSTSEPDEDTESATADEPLKKEEKKKGFFFGLGGKKETPAEEKEEPPTQDEIELWDEDSTSEKTSQEDDEEEQSEEPKKL